MPKHKNADIFIQSVFASTDSLVHTLAHITNPPSTGHVSRVSADHITNAQTKHSLCDTKHKRPQNTENQLI